MITETEYNDLLNLDQPWTPEQQNSVTLYRWMTDKPKKYYAYQKDKEIQGAYGVRLGEIIYTISKKNSILLIYLTIVTIL